MMDNMIMGCAVHEKPAIPSEKVAIDGRRCSTCEGPLLPAVPRDDRVCMMEVGDGHEPVADKEPGNPVELSHAGYPPARGRSCEGVRHGGDASVGQHHSFEMAFPQPPSL